VVPTDGVSQNVPPQDKAPGRGSGMALLAGYQTDAAFAGKLYPKTVGPSPSTKPSHDAPYISDDWGEANDPEIRV